MAVAVEVVVADDHVVLLGPERVVYPEAWAIPVDAIAGGRIAQDMAGRRRSGNRLFWRPESPPPSYY